MPAGILTTCATLAILTAAAIARADSVVVNPDGSGDYLTIQSAVDWAADGSDVLIAGGDYPEKIVIWTGRTFQFRPLESGDTVRLLGDPDDPADFPDILVIESESSLRLDAITVDGQDQDGITGVYHQGESLHLEDCTVRGCVSGVKLSGTSPDVNAVDCLFTENTVGSINASLISQVTLVFVSGCTFTDNGEVTNTGGGGILLRFGVAEPINLQVHDSHFQGNTGQGGGGINIDNINQFVITGCTFVDNSTHHDPDSPGGAVSVSGTLQHSSYLYGCTFIGNRAESDNHGGALAVFTEDDQDRLEVTLSDCVLAGNTAGGQGGAIYVASNNFFGVTVNVDDCHIINNSSGVAGGGLAAWSWTYLSDTLFCGNTPDPATGMYIDEGGNTFVDTCATGACCVGGACADLTEDACSLADGLWFGTDIDCGDVNCAEPITGACCLVRFCSVMGQGMCELYGGEFKPLENCTIATCDGSIVQCPGDFNFDGQVNIDDLLSVIGAWGACP